MIQYINNSTYEYKVLGEGPVVVDGTPLSLDSALRGKWSRDVQAILNVLGKDGWELMSIEYPYVFKRSVTKLDIELNELAEQLS
jgi:hypothetical protein